MYRNQIKRKNLDLTPIISLSFTIGFFGGFSSTATATELSSPPVSLGLSSSPVSAGVSSSPVSPARAITNDDDSLHRRTKGRSATGPVREIEIWFKENASVETLREDLVKRGEAVGRGRRREEEAMGDWFNLDRTVEIEFEGLCAMVV